MSTSRKSILSAAFIVALPLLGSSAQLPADGQSGRQEFVAAMQRVRQGQPDTADSPALKSYAIYDYLVAARLRRDLTPRTGESLDVTIDAFLRAHAGHPVAHGLRREWLANLAQRQRWDWFLPRSLDVVDPSLLCDRLTGRLATGDTAGLAEAALAQWMLPQKPLPECSGV
ncbi:MAG TPA: hypothetical protein VNW05_10780, partial [Steroidobacteraceae bacterium]|nr:hypothetical protein [Steroidobacteraceae bacterium]